VQAPQQQGDAAHQVKHDHAFHHQTPAGL
jgi:hypothetical protein